MSPKDQKRPLVFVRQKTFALKEGFSFAFGFSSCYALSVVLPNSLVKITTFLFFPYFL